MIFFFLPYRDKEIPQQVGKYTIKFSLQVDKIKVLSSNQVGHNTLISPHCSNHPLMFNRKEVVHWVVAGVSVIILTHGEELLNLSTVSCLLDSYKCRGQSTCQTGTRLSATNPSCILQWVHCRPNAGGEHDSEHHGELICVLTDNDKKQLELFD